MRLALKTRLFGILPPPGGEEITVGYVTFSNNKFVKIYTDEEDECINAREGDYVQHILGGYALIADAYEPQGVYFSLPRDNK